MTDEHRDTISIDDPNPSTDDSKIVKSDAPAEPMMRVKVREFPRSPNAWYDRGERRKPGDVFDLPERLYREVASWVDPVDADGKITRRAPAPASVDVDGMAPHERIEALESQISQKRVELSDLETRLASEHHALKASEKTQDGAPANDDRPAKGKGRAAKVDAPEGA